MKRKARLNIINQLNEQIGTLQSTPKLSKQVRRPRPLEIYFKLLAITQRIYFACNKCDEYITISEKWIRRHYNTEHQIKFTANDARPY
jgi:hypothetical protein